MSTKLISNVSSSLRQSRFTSAVLLSANLIAATLLASPTLAGQLPNGKTVFDHAPRLVSVSTNQPATFVPGGIYEFTLTVPENAGAPLQAVTISQPSNAQEIKFVVNQSHAIANGVTVPLASIGGTNSDEVTIAFEQPIQPGATITISLQAEQNPGLEGIYLFGITAHPVNDQTNGLFLGYGRVAIFNNRG